MTSIQSLLAGLFDYAGLYPPTGLSLRSAANNYLDYTRGRHCAALGRFIINADRLEELRSEIGGSLKHIKLSVIVSNIDELDRIADETRTGMRIETLEIKSAQREILECLASKAHVPSTVFVEIPADYSGTSVLQEISRLGLRAKIRMGGVTADAFPSVADVVQSLAALAKLNLPFKATAGLHHPVRSHRPLTYAEDSPRGTMHGFVNLCCAAAIMYFGGETEEAESILAEQDPSSWRVSPDAIQWRDLTWTKDQLSKLRREFLISIGSCSFEEPIHDLEVLGWL